MQLDAAPPKSQQVARFVTDEIHAGRYGPGDRLPSIRTLAERFDVSSMVISQAYERLEDQGLIERRHGSGTYVAERAGPPVIGVVSDLNIADPRTSWFFIASVQGVRERLEAAGLRSRMFAGFDAPGGAGRGDASREAMEAAGRGEIQGLVIVNSLPRTEWIKFLDRTELPVVGGFAGARHQVTWSREALVRRGVERFVAAGRQRPALLGSKPETAGHFAAALADHGLADDAGRVDIIPAAAPADTARRVAALLHRPRPDALLIADEFLYPHVMPALLREGVAVPGELMVLTHATRGSGRVYPFPVTLLEVDPADHVEHACAMVRALADGKPVADPHVTLPIHCTDWSDS